LNYLVSVYELLNTLTLALSPQGRGDLRIAPPLRGGDKGEGVRCVFFENTTGKGRMKYD
jgi:hypothetical protein